MGYHNNNVIMVSSLSTSYRRFALRDSNQTWTTVTAKKVSQLNKTKCTVAVSVSLLIVGRQEGCRLAGLVTQKSN